MPPPKFNPIRDIISGAVMAATSVPQLVAYAEIVGYAGSRGLSTAGAPLFAWGLITGSPFVNCGVTALSALMTKTDLDGESYLTEYGEEEYVRLVSAYSLYVGMASIVLAFTGFGMLAKSVPKPVRAGFKWGTAVGVFGSALPNGLFAGGTKELKAVVADSAATDAINSLKFNIPAATGAVNVANVLYGITHPNFWAPSTALLFILCTAFVMKGKKILPKALPPGTEVIITIACATLYSMNYAYKGGVVGEIPPVDPDAGISVLDGLIKVPVEFQDVKGLLLDVPISERFGGSWLMLAISAALFAGVNFLFVMGTLSVFEEEDNIPWSAPRELVAQGISCGVAAAVGSAPVSGSMSRSLVSRMTGTTSQMACLVTALCWIYLLPYMSIMSPTPKAALSAVIISAVVMSVVVPKDLLRLTGVDLVVGWATGISTALTSPTIGFGVGLLLYGVSMMVKRAKKEKRA